MALAPGPVQGADLSGAWLGAVRLLAAVPGRSAAHLVVRADDPLREDPAVRAEVDRILTARGLQTAATVANTLFPAALAARYPEPADLAEHYRQRTLPRLRRLARPKNTRGTYFGRLVEYPGPGGPCDQLTETVGKLRRERALPSPLSSCYEVAVHAPGPDADPPPAAAPALTHHSPMDTAVRMGFPCLSFLSFHLDGTALHLAAHYRNQLFLERAYGNYLGLGGLLGYVARAAGLRPGELLVVAGHATLEAVAPLRGLIDGHQPLPLDLTGRA